MTMEALNIISFVLSLILMFGLGLGVGQYMAHKRIMSTIAAVQGAGSKLIETAIGAVKNGKQDIYGEHGSVNNGNNLPDIRGEEEERTR